MNGPNRRIFLKTAGVGAAAAGAAALAPGAVAASLGAVSAAPGALALAPGAAAASVGAKAAPSAAEIAQLPAAASGSMVAYIHDVSNGQLSVMVEGREITVTDHQLVAKLAHILHSPAQV